jgi:transcriptional activator protein UGA3
MNVPRSRKLVREVWARNEGRIDPLDWLDVVVEYDWEVYLV